MPVRCEGGGTCGPLHFQTFELPRSTFRRPLAAQTPADPDAGLRTWLCAFAKAHPRWGYRRAHHDARAYGWAVNHKKTQRLWREEGLRGLPPVFGPV